MQEKTVLSKLEENLEKLEYVFRNFKNTFENSEEKPKNIGLFKWFKDRKEEKAKKSILQIDTDIVRKCLKMNEESLVETREFFITKSVSNPRSFKKLNVAVQKFQTKQKAFLKHQDVLKILKRTQNVIANAISKASDAIDMETIDMVSNNIAVSLFSHHETSEADEAIKAVKPAIIKLQKATQFERKNYQLEEIIPDIVLDGIVDGLFGVFMSWENAEKLEEAIDVLKQISDDVEQYGQQIHKASKTIKDDYEQSIASVEKVKNDIMITSLAPNHQYHISTKRVRDISKEFDDMLAKSRHKVA